MKDDQKDQNSGKVGRGHRAIPSIESAIIPGIVALDLDPEGFGCACMPSKDGRAILCGPCRERERRCRERQSQSYLRIKPIG